MQPFVFVVNEDNRLSILPTKIPNHFKHCSVPLLLFDINRGKMVEIVFVRISNKFIFWLNDSVVTLHMCVMSIKQIETHWPFRMPWHSLLVFLCSILHFRVWSWWSVASTGKSVNAKINTKCYYWKSCNGHGDNKNNNNEISTAWIEICFNIEWNKSWKVTCYRCACGGVNTDLTSVELKIE